MKYRKKPIEVEAFRFGYDCLPQWCNRKFNSAVNCNVIELTASESRHIIEHGEWVVKIDNKIKIINHDDFIATYEAVE